ncbi:carboxylating nicotinate-nucleotide diphosphorylase [Glaciimonas sp. PCH181]|uniref:carboxylating nicotinate-nucleotide diphosphorylase n=1 Tax=Glaciimonas sp. PCH181 TaxID=2133943 RepID=UPI000D395522|nr:carboxylating nicotinate-nucleotide diphosphorylase [Glaciimonas sp. PCH181]PUA19676.1 nicotinate-nucleotide diphosphorylase (carboxylating) [Glaciimonas sp. PCH181]
MFDHNETLEQARARNVRDALAEDIGIADWTAQLVAPECQATATVVAREATILCGREWFDACVLALDPQAQIVWRYPEGARVEASSELCKLTGNARALLSAERPALNFLQLLSAVASSAGAFADAIHGVSPNPTGCIVLDTRKTIPGLRQAQKYAVRTGGGSNHRFGLWDGILIKENHIAACGGMRQAVAQAQALNAGIPIQIEVENLSELSEALAAGVVNILLDNFEMRDMVAAVALNARRAVLEVSGGVSLDTIAQIAATGVDRISTGKMTKDLQAVDLSLRIVC